MRGLKGLKLGVLGLGIVAALVGGVLLAAQVSAQMETVSVSDGTAAPGAQGSVELSAIGIGDPGLGAWTIDISYDPDVVSVVDCAPAAGGVCNPAFDATHIRVTGASATGLLGDTTLADITLECADAADSTALGLTINVFADATIGDPQDIAADASEGTFTCEEPAPEPTATTAVVTTIVDTGQGFGGSDDGSTSLLWVVGLLAAIGAAGIVGFGALRIRSRA